MPSPQASDPWQIGNPYEQYIGRWSRRVAPVFLTWLDIPAGKRWVDLGCGTGALCAAIMERCAPASLTGIEPSEGFLEVARETLPIEVTLLPGTADAIPLADGAADVVVSGLVMNFVPDLGAALEEVRRVAAPASRLQPQENRLNLQLTGLHAVVTGGSSGIGAAIVQALAAEGCRVSFCARRQAPIDAALERVAHLPGPVQAHAVNVTDSANFTKWLATLGPFDIFIPNVSALSTDWKDSLQTDIQATVDATEAAVPFLLKSPHAAITYIGSKAGSLAAPTSASYGAAKAATAQKRPADLMRSNATRHEPPHAHCFRPAPRAELDRPAATSDRSDTRIMLAGLRAPAALRHHGFR